MPEFVKRNVIVFIYFALVLSTLLVFWQVRNFDFVRYDDNEYVYENPHVLNGLTRGGAIWAFSTACAANWHPVTWLSLMLDCQLFSANPGVMHLINLFLHLGNTLLLFTVLRKMTGVLWPSAFVAAAFALHPMHVESVAWIAERKDVLSTLFLLLTLAAYVSYVKNSGTIYYLLTLLLFTLGLMSKPMLVTLPFLLLLLDYWPLERIREQKTENRKRRAENTSQKISARRLLIEKIPFFVLSVASSVITFLIQRSIGAMADIYNLPLKDRIANAFLSYAKYTGKMVWPQNLAVFYPFDALAIRSWQMAMSILLLVVISIFVIRFGRNRKYLPVGWLWFVSTLVPVIGLVQVGGQAYADRYTYIPYIGLFIMLAWGLPELFSKLPYRKFILGISAAVVLTILGVVSYRQVSYWNNNMTLFSRAVEVTQNNFLAYNNLGLAYQNAGRWQDEVEAYKHALQIEDDYDTFINLGIAYGKLGRTHDEILSYEHAIQLEPNNPKAYNNLGIVYEQIGRLQDAIKIYNQAIKVKPDYAEAYLNLGVTYYKLGRYQDATELYKQAVRIKPGFVLAHYNLGVVYLATGDKESALEEYKILKTLGAKQADQLYNLINK